jgi:hypothetical protein
LECHAPRIAERCSVVQSPAWLAAADLVVLGGCAAENRGADFVKLLVPSLRARTRSLTGHREPHNQTGAFAFSDNKLKNEKMLLMT